MDVRDGRWDRKGAVNRECCLLELLGALAVLATGAVHLHEFERFYSQIPTIGAWARSGSVDLRTRVQAQPRMPTRAGGS